MRSRTVFLMESLCYTIVIVFKKKGRLMPRTMKESGNEVLNDVVVSNGGEMLGDEEKELKRQRRIGALVLSLVSFDDKNEEIVDSSFDKARRKGEKLPGNSSERRIYAYLLRLEELINKYGNPLEKRLWRLSINNKLLVEYDNIPESYWESKRQELRDNGAGSVKLTESLKREYCEKERELQRESLEKWANYLGDEHSPYPLWFKIYAWDGMTKMGVYNKDKRKYEVRNETTVAPYPDPDAEIIAGVFEAINRYYGNSQREFYTKEGERNIKMEQLVQSGSFRKIYEAIQQNIAPIIEPPETTEEVRGEWIEYGVGDEDKIARAANGTGWCIAAPAVAKHYLECGTYGESHDEKYGNSDSSNHSKFILFHLIDPVSDKLAKNACASIRLDPDGRVAEISGLRTGQALDDSMVPIVEEKAKTLPGGEKFLLKFADKNRLIMLDHKMKNNEELTKEELEFVYEIDRRIETLDTYNACDPRIKELRRHYDIEYACDKGLDINSLIERMDGRDIEERFDHLVNRKDIDINRLINLMFGSDIEKHLNYLANRKDVDINLLIDKMYGPDIEKHFDYLVKRRDVNINTLAERIKKHGAKEHLDILRKRGANI